MSDAAAARRRRRDGAFGLGMALAAAAFVLWAVPLGVVTPRSVKALPLSPAFLPLVLAVLVGLLGLVVAVQAMAGPGAPQEADGPVVLRGDWPLRAAAVFGVLGAYVWFSEWLGMLPLAIGATAILLAAGGERSVWRGLAVSLLLPLGVFLFFTQVAQVPLPPGFLEGWQ
jgi:uncharacterized membrane protein (UPF0136 family)